LCNAQTHCLLTAAAQLTGAALTTNLTRLLVSTRFSPPRIGTKYIPRARLIALLEQAGQCRLTLVTGGAGYGKTTLLAQWRQKRIQARENVAWLSLTQDEKGFAEFVAAFVAAIQRVGITVDIDLAVEGNSAKAVDAAVVAIVDRAAELADDAFVILDDYHHVESPWAHRFLQKLLDHCPDNLHLIIASRVAPPLGLSRLRMMNQIVEIDASELPFSTAETKTFLDGNLGGDKLNADELRVIEELTGGWPSCLQLITIMLKNRPESRARLRDLIWHSDDLQAYLSEEVMDHLPAELAAFSESLSVFRRFNAGLAEAVTGVQDAGEWLKRMDSENLLIVRIESDERTPWYRFHPLFGEYLITRLDRRGIEAVEELHRRGARWFAANDFVVEAVRHAALGDDVEFAVQVIEQAAPATWTFAYLSPMLHLLERLPEEALARHQRLFYLACLTTALTAQPARARNLLAQLRAAGTPPEPSVAALPALVEAAIAYQEDDSQRIVDLLGPRLNDEIGNPFLRYMLQGELAAGYAGIGRYADARRLLDSHPIPASDRDNDMALLADATRIQCLMLAGNVREAERLGTPVMARAVRVHGQHSISANLCAALLADAYYELDRIDDARETIANRPGLLHVSGPDVMVRASLCRARLDLLQEGPEISLAFMQQQTAHLRSVGQHRAVAHMLATQVKVHLQLGDTARAAEISASLDEMALGFRDSSGFLAGIPAVAALARAYVFGAHQPQQALEELEKLRSFAMAHGRGRQTVLADLLEAAVLDQTDRADEAMEVFTRALQAGEKYGLVRTFVDEGVPVANLLVRFVRSRKVDEPVLRYAKDLLAHMPEAEKTTGAQRRSGEKTSVALTQRELEILALVAQAMSNKRIALTLNITVETVKWNLRNIFAKLGVSSRYHAMVWAREQSLIS